MGSVLASQVLYQQGRWQESLEPIEEAIELLPGWTELSVQLADTLFMMDELDRAVAVLEEACAEPGDAEVSCLVLGGTLEAAQGRPAEGFALTGEAIAREPDNANLYIYHAWVMAQLEKRGEAEKGGARDVFMEGIGMRPSMATKPWVLELKKDIPGLKNKTLEEGPLDPCD
jgi:predicted Zn-dependent protease